MSSASTVFASFSNDFMIAPGRADWIFPLGGGADGVRTRDLLDAIEARSQLRYGPTSVLGGTIL